MASTSGEELFFKEFEYFLRECMRDNTEVFTIVRGDTTQKAEGVREIDQREYIAFHHAADVRPGDCLRGGVLGEELWLVEVAPVMLAGHLVQTKAYYQTAAEREERLAKSATPPTALRTASVAHARFAPPRAAPVGQQGSPGIARGGTGTPRAPQAHRPRRAGAIQHSDGAAYVARHALGPGLARMGAEWRRPPPAE
jgi:hypothetical protein